MEEKHTGQWSFLQELKEQMGRKQCSQTARDCLLTSQGDRQMGVWGGLREEGIFHHCTLENWLSHFCDGTCIIVGQWTLM